MLIIHRVGKPHVETAVRITDGRGGQWWIDPQNELLQATAVLYRRDHSIVHFADGLISAGHDVLFDFRFEGKTHEIIHHQGLSLTALEYHFLGLAWGKNDWGRLKNALQHVSRSRRKHVLEQTARHNSYVPWWCRHDPIQLCFP